MLNALPAPPPAETIVVTGHALADPVSDRAYHIDVLDGGELGDASSHSLDDILKRVPSLQLFRRSDSTSGHPTSQGVTLRALGGNASSRALLILDGVPQADPFGGWVNWPAYDAAGLAEVRVIRGGGSVPYGPGALAGVIEMRSRASDGYDASLEAGSRGSARAHAYFGERFGGTLLTVDAQGGRSDGFNPITRETRGMADRAAPYEEASLRTRWTVPLAKEVEAQIGALAFVDRRDRGVDFSGNRTRGADSSIRLVGRSAWQWTLTGYAQWRNLRSSFASISDNRGTASRVSLQDAVPSRSLGLSAEVRPPVGQGTDLRVGADMRFTNGESRELYSYADGEPARRRISGGQATTRGLFAEVTYSSGPLMLTGGARVDHWSIEDGRLVELLRASGQPTREEAYPRRTGWLSTLRFGSALDVAEGASLRLAAYRGWRLPTLNELFRPFRAGSDATAANPGLDPEKLSGVEAGLNFINGRLDGSLTAFVNYLNDAIVNVTLDQGPGTFPGVGFVAGDYRQRRNIDRVLVRGLEASGRLRAGPWTFSLGTSVTHARVKAAGLAAVLNGLRPAQTPQFGANASIAWQRHGRSIGVELRHVGAQFEDDLNGRELDPATTVNAFLSWPVTRGIELTARGQNLLDETVEATINDDGSIERSTPRTIWLGLRFKT